MMSNLDETEFFIASAPEPLGIYELVKKLLTYNSVDRLQICFLVALFHHFWCFFMLCKLTTIWGNNSDVLQTNDIETSKEANGQNGRSDPNQLDSLQQSSPLSTVEQPQASTNVSRNYGPQLAAEPNALRVKVSRNTPLKSSQIDAIEPAIVPSKSHSVATPVVEGSPQEYFVDSILKEEEGRVPPHVTDDAQSEVQSNISRQQASNETSHHVIPVKDDRDHEDYSKKAISDLEKGSEGAMLRPADNIPEAEELISASNKNLVEKANKDTWLIKKFCKNIEDFYRGKPTNKKAKFGLAVLRLLVCAIRPLPYSVLLFLLCFIFLQATALFRSLRKKIV